MTFEEVQVLLGPPSSPLNEKVLRYADVLLMHAEASIMGGGGDGASSSSRFWIVLMVQVTQRRLRTPCKALRDERRRELATEGWNRFTDLVRWDALDGGGVLHLPWQLWAKRILRHLGICYCPFPSKK